MFNLSSKKILIIAGLSFLTTSLFSQTKTFEPKGSISIDLGIPTKGKNIAFGNVMEGLFNGGVSYQYNVYNGLTVGAGAKYSFFIINSFAINNADWGGGLHLPAVHIKLGYEKFTTNRISMTPSIKMGYSYMVSANDSCKTSLGGPYVKGTFFLEPQFEIVLLTDKTSSDGFSLVIGYDMYFQDFGAEFLCMDSFVGLEPEDSQGITRFISIGFGYRYYMGRK